MKSKIFTGRLFLVVIVPLLVFPWTIRATANTRLATHAFSSSAGRAQSENYEAKTTAGQGTPAGESSSENYGSGGGYWYQDPVPPSAITDLTATLSADDIALQWSHAADNVAIDHYVVYRGTDPRFEATGGDSVYGTKGTTYLDVGVVGVVGTNYFYLVKATDTSGNLAEDSNRVGEFDSGLSNGLK
jgi:hypothetical protein